MKILALDLVKFNTIESRNEAYALAGNHVWVKIGNPFSKSPPLQRMINELQLSGRGKRSQQSCSRAIRKFSEFLQTTPDLAAGE